MWKDVHHFQPLMSNKTDTKHLFAFPSSRHARFPIHFSYLYLLEGCICWLGTWYPSRILFAWPKGVVELSLNLAHLGCQFTSCFSYQTLVFSLNSTLGFLICITAWRSKNPILFCGLYRGASTHLVFLQAQLLSPSTIVQFELWGIFKNNRLGWIMDSLSHAKVSLSLSLSLFSPCKGRSKNLKLCYAWGF